MKGSQERIKETRDRIGSNGGDHGLPMYQRKFESAKEPSKTRSRDGNYGQAEKIGDPTRAKV
jgi:hypothetical protein